MKYLTFKNKDIMPILGLGTWKSKPKKVYFAVKEAIKMGYRHIDCAAIYGNEKEIGHAIRDSIKEGEIKRKDLWITSKLWNNAHEKHKVENALNKTLKDLQLDYLDLYLVHWPVALKPEVVYPEKGSDFISPKELPILETWNGMVNCLDNKITRHIGVSNFCIKNLENLLKTTDFHPEMNQIELHPFLQQPEMLKFCKKNNILLTAYAPLGSGDRPIAIKQKNEPSLLTNQLIDGIAKNNNCSPAQVLIAWAINRKTAVIPKSVNKVRMIENFKSTDIQLSNRDMEKLSSFENKYRFVSGKFWTMAGSPYTIEYLWDE